MKHTENQAVYKAAVSMTGLLARALMFSMLAAMVYSTPLLLDADASSAYAQGKKDKEKRFEGKKVESLGKKVYDAVTKANEYLDNDDAAGARREVDKAKAFPNKTPYETAQVHYLSGALYFNAEKYAQAKRDFDTVIAQPDLPEGLRQNAFKTLSQLCFALETYQCAVTYARQYMDEAGEDPDLYAVIATAEYYKQGSDITSPDKIIQPIERAIALARERGTSTKETWWQLARVAYWVKEDYRKVKESLEVLVAQWPKKEYWTQLSGVYSELKDEPRQLAAYEAAYDQGMLERSGELVQMAQLFMQADAPYKGAKVLEKGFSEGKIEKNVRNYRLLSQAWQMAQEHRKAIGPLQEAAKLSNDGDLYALLAQSYLNLGEYRSCIDTSRQAINKGKLKYPGDARLILGKCQYETKALNSARETFKAATRFEKSASDARNWIRFVDSELARVRELEESLELLRRQQAEAAADS